MDVIPVIDLKGGQVVHARQGQRDAYQPLATPLSAGSAPRDVVAGLLRLYPFRTLYVADLDAIAGSGDHVAALEEIATLHPGLDSVGRSGDRRRGFGDGLAGARIGTPGDWQRVRSATSPRCGRSAATPARYCRSTIAASGWSRRRDCSTWRNYGRRGWS